MESIKQLFLFFAKGHALLLGIAMLIGGGLCSVSIPLLDSKETIGTALAILIAFVVIGSLIFLSRKQNFPQQVKYLALLIAGLFLVGGGLCSIIPMTQKLGMFPGFAGLLLIDIAVTLCGYILVRWILTIWKKPSP